MSFYCLRKKEKIEPWSSPRLYNLPFSHLSILFQFPSAKPDLNCIRVNSKDWALFESLFLYMENEEDGDRALAKYFFCEV